MNSILLVDDDLQFLALQKELLTDQGYQCLVADSAAEALAVLEHGAIDLLLLDIRLPGQDGLELLPKLKTGFPALSIIVTASDDLETATHCLDLGADDFLVKPFAQSRLLISIRNALAKQALLENNRCHNLELQRQLAEQAEKIKASQQMLIQQERLAAIGQLAAGVAHEINNPLGFVISNLSTLARYGTKFRAYISAQDELLTELPDETQQKFSALRKEFKFDAMLEDLPELMAETLEGATRMREIVKGLKCFSRNESEEPVVVDINQCLESAVTIVWNQIKYTAKLERDFGELPPVRGFQQQLAQVFMNLLVNASHAIEKDGLIHLRSRHDGDQVLVSVTDNGCGIAPDHLERIFEPFFTTKGPDQGTGLGMSIVQEILQRHSGSIAVDSAVGQGTKFTISLPVDA